MPNFLISPRFQASQNALYFETNSLNALARAEYNDQFGFYQQNLGVYSYMRLNKDLDFTIHYAQGTPLMWQTHNSCAWTPTGTLTMAQKTISPCKVKINEEYCYDELFDSTFKSLLDWGGSATVGMDEKGRFLVDELARTIIKNATLGARLTLSSGQLHDLTAVTFDPGTSTNIQEAFTQASGACSGWINLVRTLSATIPHLENGLILGADISTDSKNYTGDALALYDNMLAGAPDKLYDAVVEGGISGTSDAFYPLWIVSPSVYRAVYAAYQVQSVTASMNQPRIEKREFNQAGSRPKTVFFIDETAVVPLHEINHFDQYVKGNSHFAYLTLSGVIQLGSSFASIPGVPNNEVAVMIEMSTRAKDYGKYHFLSHALMGTAINDTDFITGDYTFAVAP